MAVVLPIWRTLWHGGAKRLQLDETLNAARVVVLPDLVAFDGPLGAAAAANLAAVTSRLSGELPQAVPFGRTDP